MTRRTPNNTLQPTSLPPELCVDLKPAVGGKAAAKRERWTARGTVGLRMVI